MRIKIAIVILAALLVCSRAGFAQAAEKFLVVVKPVADIRSEPQDSTAGYEHDDLAETQVLYNEILRYQGENTGWYKVEAGEQPEFSHHNQWQGYPGWIKKNNVRFIEKLPEYTLVVNNREANVRKTFSEDSDILTIVLAGTKFKDIGSRNDFYTVQLADNGIGWIAKQDVTRIGQSLSKDRRRKNIISAAKLFLDVPYVWGGRSMHAAFINDAATGVDCSGLVNLAYRMSGLDISRDAHEQWMTATPIAARELQPGDLIFVSKPDNAASISHVMLSLGGEDFIEGPGTGAAVRICDFKAKFGLDRQGLEIKGYIVEGRKLYFGRMIP